MVVAPAGQVDAGEHDREAMSQPRREGEEEGGAGRVRRERVGDQLKLYNHYSTRTD